ncbi:MAG: hypothetical protein HFF11_09390 [Angelakisella sp.]|jgi:two-component sensor histidine kinase|nr:hypothetical protein [Angelakisella sp.]
MTIRELCWTHTALTDDQVDLLERAAAAMQYTADLTGADIFIDCLDREGKTAIVVAHAKPSGVISAYRRTVLGQAALPEKEPAVYHAFRTGMVVRDLKAVTQEDQTVRQDAAPIRDAGGRVIGVMIREKDISSTVTREKKFRELARERETRTGSLLGLTAAGDSHTVAMKEIHHRVKNNLQLVASILNIQARKAADPQLRRAFRENTSRVLSIAAIHDILTTGNSGGQVELLPLLEKLRRNLQSMLPRGRELVISVRGDKIAVSSDKATSIALVVNELLTNALEHGFQGRQRGTVTVTLLRGRETSTITVEDNGQGFSPGETREESLGLDLISTIVRDKLGGKLQLQSGPEGTKAMFDFGG